MQDLKSKPIDAPAADGAAAPGPLVPPLLVRRVEAARLCGMSPAAWDRLSKAGKTPAPLRLGGVLAWSLAELTAWVKAGCPDRKGWQAMRAAAKSGRR